MVKVTEVGRDHQTYRTFIFHNMYETESWLVGYGASAKHIAFLVIEVVGEHVATIHEIP